MQCFFLALGSLGLYAVFGIAFQGQDFSHVPVGSVVCGLFLTLGVFLFVRFVQRKRRKKLAQTAPLVLVKVFGNHTNKQQVVLGANEEYAQDKVRYSHVYQLPSIFFGYGYWFTDTLLIADSGIFVEIGIMESLKLAYFEKEVWYRHFRKYESWNYYLYFHGEITEPIKLRFEDEKICQVVDEALQSYNIVICTDRERRDAVLRA